MIRVKAPGRICLFGEHQDYLNYPTISMAISKYIYLEARRQNLSKFIINLPDVNEHLEIQLNNKEIEYFQFKASPVSICKVCRHKKRCNAAFFKKKITDLLLFRVI